MNPTGPTLRPKRGQLDKETAALDVNIDDLKLKESVLQSLMDSLRAERVQAEEKRRDLEAQKWPINWLPYDLLLRVFGLVTEPDEDLEEEDRAFYNRALVLTHVCKKWHDTAVSSGQIWSWIPLHKSEELINLYIARARSSPLHASYLGPSSRESDTSDAARIKRILDIVTPRFQQCRSISLTACSGEEMTEIVKVLRSKSDLLSQMSSLRLSLPRDCDLTDSLIRWMEPPGSEVSAGPKHSSLMHLCLHNSPLRALPSGMYTNLRTIELSYRSDSQGIRFSPLRISLLLYLLRVTPCLEELVLIDTPLKFDVAPEGVHCNYLESDPIKYSVNLPKLRRFEWSYPQRRQILKFLMFMNAPSLENLEIMLEDICLEHEWWRPSRIEVALDNAMTEATDGSLFHKVCHLDSLTDLNIQCADAGSLTQLFQRGSVPALQTLSLTYVGLNVLGPSDVLLPSFESIFRNPRHPHLTELTISHLQISSDIARTLLGYVPCLESLTLDTCLGASHVLSELSGNPTFNGMPGFCIKLTTLQILACRETTFESLRTLINNRNSISVSCQTSVAQTSVPVQMYIARPDSRPIKPLRKPVNGDLNRSVQHNKSIDMSSALAKSLTGGCAKVTTLRVEDCPLVFEEQALSLKEPPFSVEEIFWRT